MINTVFEILFFVYIPFLLVLVLIIRKQEKKDIGFYWGYRKQKNIKLLELLLIYQLVED